MLMPLVHMIKPLIDFFTKLISALFDEPLESLLRDIPGLREILPLNNKEMQMTVGEYIKNEMSKPESPYKSSINMILNYRILVNAIEEQNATILELIRKEQKDQEYFSYIDEYLATIAMRFDTLDLQDEEQRLSAQAIRMINYLADLAKTYNANHATYKGLLSNYTSSLNSLNQVRQNLYSTVREQNQNLSQFYIDHHTAQINQAKEQITKLDEKINIANQQYTLIEKELVSLSDGSQIADPELLVTKQNEFDLIKSIKADLEKIKQTKEMFVEQASEKIEQLKELDSYIEKQIKEKDFDPISAMAASRDMISKFSSELINHAQACNMEVQQINNLNPAISDVLGNANEFLLNAEAPNEDLLKSILLECDQKVNHQLSQVSELEHKIEDIKKEMEKAKIDMHDNIKELNDNAPRIVHALGQNPSTSAISHEIHKLTDSISHLHHSHTHESDLAFPKHRNSQAKIDQQLTEIRKSRCEKSPINTDKDDTHKDDEQPPTPRKDFHRK